MQNRRNRKKLAFCKEWTKKEKLRVLSICKGTHDVKSSTWSPKAGAVPGVTKQSPSSSSHLGWRREAPPFLPSLPMSWHSLGTWTRATRLQRSLCPTYCPICSWVQLLMPQSRQKAAAQKLETSKKASLEQKTTSGLFQTDWLNLWGQGNARIHLN